MRKVFRTNESIGGYCDESVSTSVDPMHGTHKVALKNLSLGVPENTCFGLLGPYGGNNIFVSYF